MDEDKNMGANIEKFFWERMSGKVDSSQRKQVEKEFEEWRDRKMPGTEIWVIARWDEPHFEFGEKCWLARAEKDGEQNKELRELLWLRHGCPITCLYGDDGEMQCNNMQNHVPIDFRRDSAQKIRDKLRPDEAEIVRIINEHLKKLEETK